MGSRSATTSSDPFARRFAARRAAGRRVLVVYVTAGYPDRDASLALLQGLEGAGADIIEVGVPFSDPMADGPIIQRSSQRALELGMTFERTLELIARATLRVPVVLFTYLNPLLAAGAGALARAAAAGAQGVLVTDLPLGADPELEARIAASPLAFIRLAAPTTPAARMQEIARHGSGFVYLISRLGVTGIQTEIAAELPATIERLRGVTDLPICVGFGISTPAQAREAGRFADGVVVGSALVRAAGESVEAALALVAALRAGMDAA